MNNKRVYFEVSRGSRLTEREDWEKDALKAIKIKEIESILLKINPDRNSGRGKSISSIELD